MSRRRYSPQWGRTVESCGDRIMWGAHLARILAFLRLSHREEAMKRAGAAPSDAEVDVSPSLWEPRTWADVLQVCTGPSASASLRKLGAELRAVAAFEEWDLGRVAIMPRPEDFYPPHRRPDVDYIVERARAIVPTFGRRPVTDSQVQRLADAAAVRVCVIDLPIESCGFVLAPSSCLSYNVFVSSRLRQEERRAVLLHEIGHTLGGHFGPSFRDSTQDERTCLAEYDVWEREVDLFAAIGYLSPAEQRLPAKWLAAAIREQMGRVGDLEEWRKVRGPWLARALVRRAQRKMVAPVSAAA